MPVGKAAVTILGAMAVTAALLWGLGVLLIARQTLSIAAAALIFSISCLLLARRGGATLQARILWAVGGGFFLALGMAALATSSDFF